MNELKKIFEQARTQWQKLPARARFLGALVALVVLSGALVLSFRGPVEDYTVLFGGLAAEDAAKVVEQLKAQNVPYRLQAGGASIEVPEARVHELRLSLAASGLPRGGGVGYELFDKQSFGTTSFVEQMNYRRALQGELARTISSLDAVERARVHLAVPERTLFKDDDEAPSASVMLLLKPGHRLDAQQVRGVVHLVASSVAGLKADRVTVVDEAGTPLWSGEDATQLLSAAGDLEHSLQRRVREMIDRVVGQGRSSVVVTAELDQTRIERTEDTYDRDKPALRSDSKTEERSPGSGGSGGIAGARGNLPGAPAPSAAPIDPGRIRLSETQNYELNHVFSHTIEPQTRLKRLHVAVLVDEAIGPDGKPRPRTPEELQRITALARAAAGLDETRGDRIEVASVPFATLPGEGAIGLDAPRLPAWSRWAAMGGGALLLLIFAALLARRRPLTAQVVHALPAPVDRLAATLAESPSGSGGLPAGSARDRVLGAARTDAARTARVLSSWLSVEEPK